MMSLESENSSGADDHGPRRNLLHNITLRINRFLIDKEYRPLYHLIAVVVILAAAYLLFYKNFQVHGTMMATDMTWPPLNRIQLVTNNMWWRYDSIPTVSSLQYLYWVYPTAAIAKLLNLSSAQYQFIMFYVAFSLAGVSMYVLAFKTIRSIKLPDASTFASYAGAVFAGLIYMYNPWSIQYLRPYFAYPLYAAFPLLFLALVKTFDSPSMRNIILFSLFAVLVDTSHHLVWLWFLVVTYFAYYLIIYRFAKKRFVNAIKALGGITVFYLLLNATWFLPTVGAQLAGRQFVPYYGPAITKSAIYGTSTINSLANNFRLISVWPGNLFVAINAGAFLEAILFSLPILAIIGFLLIRKKTLKNRTINYWAMMALICLLLTTGTSSILRRPYEYLVLHAPGSGAYGWMLRMSERWQFFIPIFFAMILGILLATLLARKPHEVAEGVEAAPFLERIRESGGPLTRPGNRGTSRSGNPQIDSLRYMVWGMKLFAAFAITALTLSSFFPIAFFFAQDVYSPVQIPKDYANVNHFFASQSPQMRVVWLPFMPPSSYRFTWAPGRGIGQFNVFYSNPSLSNFNEVMNGNSYFNWLQDLYRKDAFADVRMESPDIMVKKDVLTALLVPFGAKYAIYDNSVQGYDFGSAFETDKSLKLAKKTKYLSVYQTGFNTGLIWPATRTVKANSFFDNLALAQRLTMDEMRNLGFTDGKSFFGGGSLAGSKYGLVDLGKELQLVSDNPRFQQVYSNGELVYWAKLGGDQSFGIELGARKTKKGRQGIKIVSNSNTVWDISWLVGGEIPVQESEIYAFETDVKYRNVSWTNAEVQGYQAATGQWIPLAACPTIQGGDSDWKHYYCSFYIPAGISKIRPHLGGGWVKDKARGPGLSWFDNTRLSRLDQKFFQSIAPNVKPPSITSKKITAEKYEVTVRGASKPFVLAFGEAYDEHWVVRAPRGKTIRSVPLYSTINGFPIENTGNYAVTIEFEPQRQADFGLAISLITVVLSLLFLLYNWRKKRQVAASTAEETTGSNPWSRVRSEARERIKRPDW